MHVARSVVVGTDALAVEGADGYPPGFVESDNLFNAGFHFARGFVRKGDCQNIPWRNLFLRDEVGDSVCDHTRLAGASPGKNQ